MRHDVVELTVRFLKMLKRIDYPEYKYGGSDDNFYESFLISIDGEELEIKPSELKTLEKLTSVFPSISPLDICTEINGRVKKVDVSQFSEEFIAQRTNRSVQEVQGIKEIDIYLGSIYEFPLKYYLGGKQNNLVLLFTQGEKQPALYVRALEGAVKIV